MGLAALRGLEVAGSQSGEGRFDRPIYPGTAGPLTLSLLPFEHGTRPALLRLA